MRNVSLSLALLFSFTLPVGAVPLKSNTPKKGAVKAAQPAPDPQKLVTAGKRPGFYNPSDLSKQPIISAPAAILMDAETGQVLWEKNADVRKPMASTTKIMTGLLFAENTEPDDVITCLDPKITRIEESSLHIKPWEKFRAEDLLYGLMLRSANDGAVLVAQHVAGSVPAFAKMMTARAREIGAVNTNFVNPHGLTAPGHYSTARDLALITREALRNSRFADAVSQPVRVIERSKHKSDTVIKAKVKRYFYDKFPGADGVKTGYTRAAGHCFVGSATRDGRRLLSVVLDAPISASSDTLPILGWGFRRFPAVVYARKGQQAPSVPVQGGRDTAVPTVAADDVHATMDRLRPDRFAVEQEVRPRNNLWAPITKGQEVADLLVRVNGVTVAQSPLLAAVNVEPAPLQAAVRRTTGGSGAAWGATAGGLTALLIAWRYATTSAKSARRRRSSQ